MGVEILLERHVFSLQGHWKGGEAVSDTPTPRTDEILVRANAEEPLEPISWYFAELADLGRDLERELAAKDATIERLRIDPIGWISGPARGGEGTAGSRDGVPWWWDGDLLLIVVNTRSGPEISLVRMNADGDQISLDDPETGDDIGRSPDEIAWYFKVKAPDKALTDSKS